MTREDAQRSTDGQDVLNLANNLAGLRTSEDNPVDQKVLRSAFRSEKVNSPQPVVDADDDDDNNDAGLVPGEGILDEPGADEQPLPKEECILFIGDLARAINDSDLDKAFSTVGKVVMVDIKRDKLTGRNLGYGFVQMGTREEAVEAKGLMDGAEIQGRRIRVGWAQRNTALFVGDLDETVTVDVLADAFGRFGQLLPEHTYVRSGKYGWYGGVRFKSRSDAETARREMNGVRLGAQPVRVAWHHTTPGGPNVYHHGGFMGGGPARPYSVHVQFEADVNQAAVSESMIHSIFAPYGEVVAVILPQGRGVLSNDNNGAPASCRGYGFVHFSGTPLGRRCAMEAIRSLNGQMVEGIRLSTCFSKKPTGGPRPSSAPPGRMGRLPRQVMVMDHHAGGVGDVAMGFRPIAMPSPADGPVGPGPMGFGGYMGMEGGMPAGGVGGRGEGLWPMQQHYPGPCPPSGNPASPRMMHGPQAYPPGGPYGYAPYPPYGSYPPQPQPPLQPQPQYYSAQAYGGYSPYPVYHPMPPSGGPDGPMPYPMQRSVSSGGGGGNGPGGEDAPGHSPGAGYGDFHHPVGAAGGPIPPPARGGHMESFPAGL